MSREIKPEKRFFACSILRFLSCGRTIFVKYKKASSLASTENDKLSRAPYKKVIQFSSLLLYVWLYANREPNSCSVFLYWKISYEVQGLLFNRFKHWTKPLNFYFYCIRETGVFLLFLKSVYKQFNIWSYYWSIFLAEKLNFWGFELLEWWRRFTKIFDLKFNIWVLN